MFVSTINVISQSGQAYSHKNLEPGKAPDLLRIPCLQQTGTIPRQGEIRSYLPLPKKALSPSSASASGLSASAITWR